MAETPTDDPTPAEVPFIDLSEVAPAWGWNAREATAYALGWRQAVTYGAHGTEPVEDLVRIRCTRDQAGALLAGLVEAGANVTGHGSYREFRTYNVAIR